MKQKKILILTVLFLLLFSFSAFAEVLAPGAVFMGEVENIEYNKKDNNLRILAKGYIKGCTVYKEEVIAIVNENTIIIPEQCITEGQEMKIEKVDPSDFKIDVGDTILIVLSEAMTKSIPPQSTAQAIQVNRGNN